MREIPRIFCLTLPGTTRHKAMKLKLEALDMPYEFFYGNRPSPKDIPWKLIKGRTGCPYVDHLYMCGIAGCKQGHMNMMTKALKGLDNIFIFCQDDICFYPGFKDRIMDILNTRYSKDTNIFNLGATETSYWFNGYDINKDDEVIIAPVHGGDQCYMVDRDGAKLWLKSLQTMDMESDQCTNRYYKMVGKNTVTFKWDHSLVYRDPRFHEDSSIMNGPRYE